MAATPLAYGSVEYNLTADTAWEQAFENATGRWLEVDVAYASAGNTVALGVALIQVIPSGGSAPTGADGHPVAGTSMPATVTTVGSSLRLRVPPGGSIYGRSGAAAGHPIIVASSAPLGEP